MIVDYKFLDDLGLEPVPAEQKDLMIRDINQILQQRIGAKADEALTDDKRQEFSKLLDSGAGQATVQGWLNTNLPGYNEIINAEFERVKSEIRPQVAGILQTYSTTP